MKAPFLFTMGNGPSALVALTPVTYHVIFTGAILLVALAIVLWAAVLRKRRSRRERHHWHRQSRKDSTIPMATKPAAAPPAEASRRRRRRRSEPSRNPTLAETRGLPPVRDAQSAPTEHYQN